MGAELTRYTFVMSDVHLTDPGSNLNIFFAEDAFEELLAETIPRSSGGQRSTLVLLGDFVDFVRLEPWPADDRRPRRVGATEPESVAKMRTAVEANDRVFAALTKFCERDQLIVVPGNHDADFFWRGVREIFRNRLSAPSDNLSFVDGWEFVSKGLLLSHGHQFTFDNRFDMTPPFVEHEGIRHLERCWGTFFLEAVYNLVHYFAPYVNMVHPTSSAVLLGVKNLGWDKIPPPLLAKLVAFFAKHGKRLIAEKMMGSSPDELRVAEVAAMLSISAPADVLVEAERILDAEPKTGTSSVVSSVGSLSSAPGTMGRTDENEFEHYAEGRMRKSSLFSAIFGHTHRAFAPKVCGAGKLVNTGTWTGTLFLDAETPYTHEELVAAAKSPVQRLTYASLDLEDRSVEMKQAGGSPA
jgi:UDP-2,3-diacylglucosamine pyrophosphatase LpxH